MGAILVTGASGFVGRRLIAQLTARGEDVIALSRTKPADAEVAWIAADVADSAAYEDAIKSADAIVHLAAATGKARAGDYQRINVDGTKALLAAAQRAGVKRFVFVSSIAVTFEARQHYHYAESKIAAEALVRAAPLETTIVRPTMILGQGSPIEASLARLAGLPFTPVFGAGRVRIQPIDVEDVAGFLAQVVREPDAAGATIDIGGPQIFTMNELLGRIRAVAGKGGPPRLVHAPLAPIRFGLGLAEPFLLPFLPFTAGQMATFANDSVAAAHPIAARVLAHARETPANFVVRGLALARPRAPAEPDEVLTSQFKIFSRYLVGVEPTDYQCGVYREAHAHRDGLTARGGFEAFLVRCACGPAPLRVLADAYAGAVARKSVLRAKLALTLAILETSAPSFEKIDMPASPRWRALPGLAIRLVGAGLATIASIFLFAPAHLLMAER